MWTLLGRISLYIGICAAILAAVGWRSYQAGSKAGAAEVQELWNADKQAARDAHDESIRILAKQEALHAAEQEQVASRLAQAQVASLLALDSQRRVYEQRLLQSARRSEVYRDQAQASPDSCRDLASHASRLDRSLEEGRGLVEELRGALGFRDQQLRLLGEQIMNDRKLFEGGSP